MWIQKRRVDVRAVRANIERLLAETPESGVVIQAAESAENGTFVRVLDQARMAGAGEHRDRSPDLELSLGAGLPRRTASLQSEPTDPPDD